VFGAVRGGYQVLLDALREAAGAEVRLGYPVRGADPPPGRLAPGDRYRPSTRRRWTWTRCCSPCPAPALRRLLAEVAPAAASAADAVELASPVVVALAYRPRTPPRCRPPPGCWWPPTSRCRPRHSPTPPASWSHLAPSATAGWCGCVPRWPGGEAATLRVPDQELVARVRADLATLTGITAAPVAAYVQRHGAGGGGLPQVRGGPRRTGRAAGGGGGRGARLSVAGALLHGVGVPACLATADAAALSIVADLTRQPVASDGSMAV